MEVYLGIDVGSVSTNLVLLDRAGCLIDKIYLRTLGQPLERVRQGLMTLRENWPAAAVCGVGTTGSGRQLAGVVVGADVVKNEITAHAVAALREKPGVQTVLEIGGQDSKIIIIRKGMVADFAMNTVCAAGTGSFLDQQAARLGTPIGDFGHLALAATRPARIAGRCTVFAESDMIHKQQMGYLLPDIVAGLSEALVRNYLNNVGKGKEILPPVVFQGGVAANEGICEAFRKALGLEVAVPEHFGVMGAIGVAHLAREAAQGKSTRFRGFGGAECDLHPQGMECGGCSNHCEVIEVLEGDRVLARWGDRCGKWANDFSRRGLRTG